MLSVATLAASLKVSGSRAYFLLKEGRISGATLHKPDGARRGWWLVPDDAKLLPAKPRAKLLKACRLA